MNRIAWSVSRCVPLLAVVLLAAGGATERMSTQVRGSGGAAGLVARSVMGAAAPSDAFEQVDNLAPKRWFRNSGARQLIEQARRQVSAAKGVPVRWHVAEEKAADAIRKLLQDAEVVGVEVVHTPMIP